MRSRNVRPDKRNQRRVEAITRAAQRDLRTTTEQLALLDTRPGSSARERARLEKPGRAKSKSRRNAA